MTATQENLEVEAGTTFVFDFFAYESDGTTPMNLTGWDARMQVRNNYSKNGSAVLDFTTGNGKIVITPAAGQMQLTITPADTDNLAVDADGRTMYYDLELYNSGSGIVYRPFKGNFTLLPQITI